MRRFVSAGAFVALVLCGYRLMNLPVEGGSLAATAMKEGDASWLIVVALVSTATLAYLSRQKVRVIYERQKIAQLTEEIPGWIEWISKAEQRHRDLGRAKIEVENLLQRLTVLDDVSTGLVARNRDTVAVVDDLQRRLDEIAAGRGIGSAINAMVEGAKSLHGIETRLSALEKQLATLPDMLAKAHSLKTRVGKLSASSAAEMIPEIEGIVADLAEGDTHTTLSAIEEGDPESDVYLDDQVTELAESLGGIELRINTLESRVREVSDLKTRADGLKSRADYLAEKDLPGQVSELFEITGTLLDEDGGDGSLQQIEDGIPDDDKDLEGQIDALKDDITSIGERIDGILETAEKIQDVEKALRRALGKLNTA